jgi:hypothetical protein
MVKGANRMKLLAKFYEKDGVPFSIEKPTGMQYRCGVCGQVFFHKNEIEKHLKIEKNNTPFKSLKFPKFFEKISVNLYYFQDNKQAIFNNKIKLKDL